jgi:hypothetical protein
MPLCTLKFSIKYTKNGSLTLFFLTAKVLEKVATFMFQGNLWILQTEHDINCYDFID